jgi:anti-sigma factor RsiW
MKCSEADAFIHAYVDGELAGVDRATYEQHMTACETCARACRLQARFKAAVRGHLPRPPVPMTLRMTIQQAIAGAPPIRRRRFWESYPRLVPAAAAAVMFVVIFGTARSRNASYALEQALHTYNANPPLDVVDSNCAYITNWFRGKVDFNVPASYEKLGTCQGGRLVNVHDRFGAYIVYLTRNGHRLGIMVYNAKDDPSPEGNARRQLYGRDVYFGSSRGASTAAYRDRDGLSYVVTSDMDENALSNVMEVALRR